MGGGCYGGWCCGRRVLGDSVVGGGDGVMDNTSEPTNIFRSDFWGLFYSLLSLSNLHFLLSQLNVHVHVYLSLPPLAPSDVSSPLVVMATSSSITVTRALARLLGVTRPQSSTYMYVQAPQMTLQTVVTGLQPVTTYLVYVYTLYACCSVYCWWSRGGATSRH